ncbi:MAG TPA: NAD(P)/FAD-dependent oxidoreductase [Ktedonobacteraceae bacterium]
MYDIIVVGARCAGSPTAMLLARRGYRVLLLDKATFPGDVPRGHYIHQPGVARLKRWGLLDQLRASNCPPILSIAIDTGPFVLAGSPPALDGVAEAYGPRRTVLDKLLIDAAARAGAVVREGFVVQEILLEDNQVTGIRGHAPDGGIVTEQAKLVVGADGTHSLVARTVQAPTYHVKQALTCAYFSYWSGVPIKALESYKSEHCSIFAFPTNDDLICITIEWPLQHFQTVRADIEGSFRTALEQAPRLAERMQGSKREARFMGTAEQPNFYRKPYGPGWALVGDAGYQKDAVLAQGITDAFRDAELLAEAIDAGFAGRMPLEEAMSAYEQKRNAASMPIYELNWQSAAFELPPPQIQQLHIALRENQAAANRYFGTLAGTVPLPAHISDLFSGG